MKTLLLILFVMMLIPGLVNAQLDLVKEFDQELFDSWSIQSRTSTPTWQSSDSETAIPEVFELGVAYPNPFNPSTMFTVSLPEAADLKVAVYNVLGQQIAILADQRLEVGRHTFTFDAKNLASGVYIIHAVVPGELNEMQKVFMMK